MSRTAIRAAVLAAGFTGLAAGLAGCRPEPVGAAQAYLAAVESGRGEDCAALADPVRADPMLVGECQAFAAWALVDAGDEPGARAACAAMPAGPWRDECHFGLADRLDPWGAPLRELCDQAGAFRDACLSHALGRRAQAVLSASAPGDEVAAFAQVEVLAVQVFGPQRGPARARVIARKAIAARLEGGDLSTSHCGAAPAALCAEGYAAAVLAASGGRAAVGEVCRQGVSFEALRALGWPAWTDDAEPLARQGWRELCAPTPARPSQHPARPSQDPARPSPAGAPRPSPRRRASPRRARPRGRWLALSAPLTALSLLAACEPPAARPGPARAYLDAAAASDPDACLAVQSPALRAECQVFAAASLAAEGGVDVARALCEGMEPGTWRDECWFTVADEAQASGPAAIELCTASGAFREPCLGHAIARDARHIMQALPVGQEQAALAALETLAISYLGQPLGRARARQNLHKAIAARFRAAGHPPGVFDPALCGDASPPLCRGAYAELVTFTATAIGRGEDGQTPGASGEARIRMVCAGPRTDAAVRAQGLPGWVPAGEEAAVQTWQDLCSRGNGSARRR